MENSNNYALIEMKEYESLKKISCDREIIKKEIHEELKKEFGSEYFVSKNYIEHNLKGLGFFGGCITLGILIGLSFVLQIHIAFPIIFSVCLLYLICSFF